LIAFRVKAYLGFRYLSSQVIVINGTCYSIRHFRAFFNDQSHQTGGLRRVFLLHLFDASEVAAEHGLDVARFAQR
jgi:hypothetical protein